MRFLAYSRSEFLLAEEQVPVHGYFLLTEEELLGLARALWKLLLEAERQLQGREADLDCAKAHHACLEALLRSFEKTEDGGYRASQGTMYLFCQNTAGFLENIGGSMYKRMIPNILEKAEEIEQHS